MHACFDENHEIVWKAFFTHDDRFVVSADLFNGLKVWNLEKNELEFWFKSRSDADVWMNDYKSIEDDISGFLF